MNEKIVRALNSIGIEAREKDKEKAELMAYAEKVPRDRAILDRRVASKVIKLLEERQVEGNDMVGPASPHIKSSTVPHAPGLYDYVEPNTPIDEVRQWTELMLVDGAKGEDRKAKRRSKAAARVYEREKRL